MVNGSRGRVVRFEEMVCNERGVNLGQFQCPIVRFDNGNEKRISPVTTFHGGDGGAALVRAQLPLKLAWALTVHKSQGMTLTRVEVQLADAFEVIHFLAK